MSPETAQTTQALKVQAAAPKELKKENPMKQIKIEKVILSSGAVGAELEKSKKLLEILSGMKAQVIASVKRIPTFNVRPGLEVGTKVTLRGKKALELLKNLLGAIDNTLREEQISDNLKGN